MNDVMYKLFAILNEIPNLIKFDYASKVFLYFMVYGPTRHA